MTAIPVHVVANPGEHLSRLLDNLALVFILLKLSGHIDWRWPLVLLPFWGPYAVVNFVDFVRWCLKKKEKSDVKQPE